VLRERAPLFIASREDYLTRFPAREGRMRATTMRAWAFLPLVASGRATGSLTIGFAVDREFSPEERSLLVSVSGLVAQTLARTRQREAERALAAELQAQLLPRALPETPGLVSRARYLPATDDIGVGGDWYDVLALPDHRVGLVIGDVQGHSMTAAAVMGQLRNALRAYATEGHEPAAVLARTNRLMNEIDPALFATCCYVVVDLRSAIATVALAGHPPPLLRTTGGQVVTVRAPVGPPLGVEVSADYATYDVPLALGDVIVLLTDGLVEDARRPIDEGLATLSRVLGATGTADVDDLADALLAATQPVGHRADDIALLAVRHDGLADAERPTHARLAVDRDDPRAARAAREFIGRVLATPDLSDFRETCVLLVSEVVTNALRHTDGTVTLDLWLFGGHVRVEVADETSRTPVAAGADPLDEAGRGVPVMDALSDRWGTAPHGAGKVVWFELDLPTPAAWREGVG
jgi:serine phosphatase RsbU (regulator of sigma subunit)